MKWSNYEVVTTNLFSLLIRVIIFYFIVITRQFYLIASLNRIFNIHTSSHVFGASTFIDFDITPRIFPHSFCIMNIFD